MPIAPHNKAHYPANWHEIRERVRRRSGNRCEGSPAFPNCRAANGQPHPETGSKVVLTVAHLDHQPENCSLLNLRHWCQRCHLVYDKHHHAANAKATRERKEASMKRKKPKLRPRHLRMAAPLVEEEEPAKVDALAHMAEALQQHPIQLEQKPERQPRAVRLVIIDPEQHSSRIRAVDVNDRREVHRLLERGWHRVR